MTTRIAQKAKVKVEIETVTVELLHREREGARRGKGTYWKTKSKPSKLIKAASPALCRCIKGLLPESVSFETNVTEESGFTHTLRTHITQQSRKAIRMVLISPESLMIPLFDTRISGHCCRTSVMPYSLSQELFLKNT